MNTLVAPSSSPGRQLGHHLIDGVNMLGLRNVLTHSPLSLTLVEDKIVRHSGSDSTAVQALLEQPRVSNINHTVGKSTTDLAGSCTPAAVEGREDGVAEFKGPAVHGLVRFAQVNDQEARIEAEFDGLRPGRLHSCSVNEYGDLREGAASTGNTYSPFPIGSLAPSAGDVAAGVLGTVFADNSGHAQFVAMSSRLEVWDVIGRSVVLYQVPGNDAQEPRGTGAVAAAVIARSSVCGSIAGGPNRLCACDGTVVWQSK